MKPIIIDTREPFEYAESHVSGSVNIPPAQFVDGTIPSVLDGVAKDHPIIVYCRSGSRSNVVKHILTSHGYTNIENGINELRVNALLGR